MIWDDQGLTILIGDGHYYLSNLIIAVFLIAASVFLFFLFLVLSFAPKGDGSCRWKRLKGNREPSFTK